MGEADASTEAARSEEQKRDAAKDSRLKVLTIPLFGEERHLGLLPTRLHSDFRHVVDMIRRNKQPRLSSERISALEATLAERVEKGCLPAEGMMEDVRSIADLRAQVETWRQEGRRAFDADKYYDGDRAAGYTERNRGPQLALTRRTLQLCGLETVDELQNRRLPGDTRPPREALLMVDLGCGSGLSTVFAQQLLPAQQYAAGIIGLDLSSEMLRADSWREAADVEAPLRGERLRADLAQPLPFREGVFDVAYSVGAVHYIAEDASHRSSSERLATFLSSLRKMICPSSSQRRRRACVCQAFLAKAPEAASRFQAAALKCGWGVCDLL
eukprot:TRINITY_DN18526_c0_g1_i3.p1 TRINITY_DN18526_c0_g1~~TRINITY_DN18526_c0_g1_i3.p1  ORF type:complete len:375 (+),score=43.18 TRINITY_DN18526_c0_g1_i3:144-1127(+)